ncbi:hypothetical protein CAEBREN_07850 [Caenorhabditis brenneri]|uniref:Arb2 domain-containing protein n=1 Tax=Caenorhabditis brenneri TaxID=135651 RepID=G0P7N5_CAEBE|nr:hypothetical protein CAEBREN_07850 [Caenorhabditis brenneri]
MMSGLSLDDLGYRFDDEGVLRTVKDGKTFEFVDQAHYDMLGEAVDEEIYKRLVEDCGLEKKLLRPPGKVDDYEDEDLAFVFVSKDWKKAQKLLVLVHGSGVVRAGQWARRLIINYNLECGTQFPYIKRALALGWGVVVMNTNMTATLDQDYKYSNSPVEHAESVWKTYITPSKADQVFLVAHSRGGTDMADVLKKHGLDERVNIICLTDSPWFDIPRALWDRKTPFFAINFLARGSVHTADYAPREYKKGFVQDLYSGTKTHEFSSHCAIDAIFYILQNLTLENHKETMVEAQKLVHKEPEKEDILKRGSEEKKKDTDGDDGEPKVKKARQEDEAGPSTSS